MRKTTMSRSLKDYRAKSVPGLYSFNHYEAQDGSFVQVSHRGDLVVHQDATTGNRTEYSSVAALKSAWEAE
jgi:hypothetical protein